VDSAANVQLRMAEDIWKWKP
ncbi:hypothetical protein A2U01_0058385, partial [Trifolium medium]|nr:hypothetical protein [Trifolium medium]